MTLRLPEALQARAQAHAERTGMSLNKLVALALDHYLVNWASMQRPAPASAGLSSTGKPVKVGRNEPCPCGSGKKYKLCHGAAEAAGR